jgi:basic membrane lipoprotein Med (substrate-binding protein (PBP1-ABC) superfamily)
MRPDLSLVLLLLLSTPSIVVHAEPTAIVTELYDSMWMDDGWNLSHEQARARAESQLVALGYDVLFRPVPNVKDNDEAYAIMKNHALEGTQLFIIHNIRFTAAANQIAEEHPDVLFITTPSLRILPDEPERTYRLYFYLNQGAWLAGMTCAHMSKTRNVGIINFSLGRGQVAVANAFYLGAKHVDPDIQVHIMKIDAISDPAQESRSAQILANDYKVDCGTAGSLVISHRVWAELGVASVGYWNHNRYIVDSDLVYMHVAVDFTELYLKGLLGFVNGTWPGGQEDWGYVDEVIFLRDFSPMLPAAIRRIITDEYEKVANGSERIFCGNRIAPLFPEYGHGQPLSGQCLTDQMIQQNLTRWHPGLINNRNMTFDEAIIRVFLPASEPYSIAIMVIVAFGFLVLMGLALYVAYYRHHVVVRSASPFFLLLIILGCGMMLLAAVFVPGIPSTGTCQAQIWLFALGFSIAFGSMIVKIGRIYRIFTNETLSAEPLKDIHILPGVLVVFLVMVILLLAWSLSEPYAVADVKWRTDLRVEEYDAVCHTDSSVMPALTLVYGFCILLASSVVAYLSSNTLTQSKMAQYYDESKQLGMTCFCVFVVQLAMTASYLVTSYSPLTNAVIFTLAFLITPITLTAAVFGRILRRHWRTDRGLSSTPTHTTGNSGSGTRRRNMSSSGGKQHSSTPSHGGEL